MNVSKSSALDITGGKDLITLLRPAFPFHWATDSISYLGVNITPDPSSLYSENFIPLLTRLKADLLHWYSLTVTWFGSCNALKMTLLPRVLYLLQALPIRLPPVFFKRVNSMFKYFIWSHRRSHIKLQLIHLAKHRGGVGLPNVKAYYRATHLTRLVDWHCHTAAKHCVAMEMEDSGRTAKSWPLIPSPLPKTLIDHPTLGSTLLLARDTFRHFSVTTALSYGTSIGQPGVSARPSESPFPVVSHEWTSPLMRLRGFRWPTHPFGRGICHRSPAGLLERLPATQLSA